MNRSPVKSGCEIGSKHLIEGFATDWIGLLAPMIDLPPSVQIEPLDADLSTVQVMADKVFRLRHPDIGILHLEPQASRDAELPDRLLVYNSLIQRRHGGPVHSVVILLRREADFPAMTGTLSRTRSNGREFLRFEYDVIRAWQLSADTLLEGPIGALPLSVLADDARGRLEDVVGRMDRRLRDEPTPDSTRKLLLASSFILSGLRYNEDEIQTAFLGVTGMKESITYQAILREGRSEGIKEGIAGGTIAARQADLIDVLEERFGVVPPELATRIRTMSDSAKLQAAIRQAVRVQSLSEFQL